jgi:adenylate kinase
VEGREVRLLMLGAPGSGKGTQARRLGEHFEVAHLSTGEMLRAEIAAGTPLGREVKDIVAAGDLVPDDIVERLVHDRVLEASRHGGYVLDGFPRTIHQAVAAYDIAKEADATVHAVVHLYVPEDELLTRLLGRGEARLDDDALTIRHRLEVYHERTEPLINYYEGRGVLATIDGRQQVDDVFTTILERLREYAPAD